MSSLILYLSCFIVSAVFLLMAEKRYSKGRKNISTKIYVCISFLIPVILAGIRFKVGTDFNNYYNLFFNTKDMQFVDFLDSNVEVGHFLIIKIAAVFDSVQLMFFIYSFLTILFVYLAILNNKQKLSISLSLFLYLLTFFPTSFNIIRQMLSVSIILYAYKFMIDRKFKRFTFCILVASMFHITSLIVLPFYLITPNKEKISSKMILRIFVVLALILIIINFASAMSILNQFEILDKYSLYINSIRTANNEVILKMLILVFILPFRKRLIEQDKENAIFLYLLIIDLILTFTGDISPFIKRIALYFGIVRIFVLSSIIRSIKRKNEKFLFCAGVIGYAILYFILSYYILDQGDVIPYQTMFNETI